MTLRVIFPPIGHVLGLEMALESTQSQESKKKRKKRFFRFSSQILGLWYPEMGGVDHFRVVGGGKQ